MATSKKVSAQQAGKRSAKKRAAGVVAPGAEIDRQLARYRSMRDFSVTDEPSGGTKRASAEKRLPFVIQKHAASHLHYDFRLGWKGVLKSWACAKGPSYYPGDKRLAVQVEDHPMEYGGFEGLIPQGQYGGGTVMLWDQGTWQPQAGHEDVDAGLRNGSLKFVLHGTKMKGKWALVRMGGKAASEKKPNWLLIKEHDEFERGKGDTPITEEAPNSVATGRSLEQIAEHHDHVWNSKDGGSKGKPGLLLPAEDGVATAREKMPAFIPPELATQAKSAPKGDGWLHELKLDGYRIQARKQADQVQMLTRTGLDWTQRMKEIASEVAKLPAKDCILDGEVVVLAADGTTSFAELQAAFQDGAKKTLTYFVFDLLHLDGHNLRSLRLLERKRILQELLRDAPAEIRFSEHLDTNGAAVFEKACELHAEGIVSKRASGRYISGRGSDWLKLKCIHEQEFVVGGFTLPSKGHTGLHGIGALLLGYYDGAGELIYAGRTGTGFTQKTHRALRTQLDALRQGMSPFSDPPAEARRGAVWVKPAMVAEVRFATWTSDGLVRQASFQGLREDKSAKEVRREEPASRPKSKKARVATHTLARPIAAKHAGKQKTVSEGAPVRLTHPDKVVDVETGVTKQQLAEYYWAIAPFMLPFISDRPLSIVRCPDGSTKPCFFQKHSSGMLPAGIGSVEIPDKKTGKLESYITVGTLEGLAGLAQIGVLEVHPWGSRNEDLEHPDRMIIDLDPDASIAWHDLAEAAQAVRRRFKKLGLESFLKLTGGKGLHVVVPIEPRYDWSIIKKFTHELVLEMEKEQPSLYLTKMSKAARKGRIFLDYLRNERGATAVAAFSPRARSGMPVSMPLAWSELKQAERPVFPVADFSRWKARLRRDPWKELAKVRQGVVV